MAKLYSKSHDVADRRIRREHVLVPIMPNMERLDSIYTLNDVASFIWGQLDRSVTSDEIVARLIREYEVDESVAKADTDRVLMELISIGAVNIVDQGE